ncbi:MAG: hypothetical protein CMP23_13390 [Rickettsiales bacterium]|nr:hypothetical protein [Rickettsiales bacterium]
MPVDVRPQLSLLCYLFLLLLSCGCAQLSDGVMFGQLGDDDDSAGDDDDSVGDDDDSAGDDDDSVGDDDDSVGDDDDVTSDCGLGWLLPSDEPVSFSAQVLPIFLDHCADCHTLKGLGKLYLTSQQAYEQLVGVPNLLNYQDLPRVQAGDPQGSYLIHKILDCGASDPLWGYFQAPMPPPLPDSVPLEPEEIAIIWSWVAQGAENN